MVEVLYIEVDVHTNDATTKPWVDRCEAKYDMAHDNEAMFTVHDGRLNDKR